MFAKKHMFTPQALSPLVDLIAGRKPRKMGHVLFPLMVAILHVAFVIGLHGDIRPGNPDPLFFDQADHVKIGLTIGFILSVGIMHLLSMALIKLRDSAWNKIEARKDEEYELDERESNIAKEMKATKQFVTGTDLGPIGDHRMGHSHTVVIK